MAEAAAGTNAGPRFASLRARLLALVALALAPAFALVLWNQYRHLLDQRSAVQASALRIAHSRAFEFAEKVDDMRSLLEIVGGFPTVREDPRLERCSAILADMRRSLPLYANLGVALGDGTLACSAEPFNRANPPVFAQLEWFRRSARSGQFAAGEYVLGRTSGKHLFVAGLPVAGSGAVAFAALDLSWLSRFVADLPLAPGAVVVVLDQKGRILARHPEHDTWVGSPHPHASLYLEGAAGRDEGPIDTIGTDGVERLGAFARVPGTDLTVFFGVPKHAADAPAREAFARSLAIMAAIGLASFALTWAAAELLVLRRTRRLSDAAARLAAGDTDARAGLAGRDEIGRLAAAFDAMAEAVAGRERELEKRVAARTGELRSALREVEDLYDHAPCGYHSLDANGAFVRINATELGWLGYRRDELVGRARFVDLLEPHSRELFESSFPDFLRTGRVEGIEYGLVRKDGSILPVSLSATAIRNADGRFVMSRSIVFDFTELKRARTELQCANADLARASRMKSDFLASMSHELRTPLNAIIGFSELLRDGLAGDVNEEQREYLRDILDSGTHLLSLINDILDLSKVEAGQMTLELESLSMAPVLQAALTVVRERALSHRVALELRVAPDVGEIYADERKVKQILYNLLSNAVKFTPAGGRVTLSARRVGANAPPRSARTARRDPGVRRNFGSRHRNRHRERGPAQAVLRVHADRFVAVAQVRGHGTGPGPRPASGGIARRRRRARECAGPRLDFPLLASVPTRARRRLRARGRTTRVNKEIDDMATVLMVEDNPTNLKLGALLLEKAGHTVLRAEEGGTGVEMARQALPDLVLMDVQMPGVDGMEALRRLRADPATSGLKIVALTALAMKGDEERLIAAGFDGYIAKPYRPQSFINSVEAALQG